MQLIRFKNSLTVFLKVAAVILIAAVFIELIWPSQDITGETSKKIKVVWVKKSSSQSNIKPVKASVNKKVIALTFDDGPVGDSTVSILRTLKKYNAVATFFVVGREVEDGKAVVKRAVLQGCEIGNHTWEHKIYTRYQAGALHKSLKRTRDAVMKYTGFDVKIVRPTYGDVNTRVRKASGFPLIYWNIDTEDWKYRDAKHVAKKVIGKVKSGDIVLMHDIYKSTAKAVEKIVPYLIKKGYELVTVSELMKRKGITMKPGAVYYSSRQ